MTRSDGEQFMSAYYRKYALADAAVAWIFAIVLLTQPGGHPAWRLVPVMVLVLLLLVTGVRLVLVAVQGGLIVTDDGEITSRGFLRVARVRRSDVDGVRVTFQDGRRRWPRGYLSRISGDPVQIRAVSFRHQHAAWRPNYCDVCSSEYRSFEAIAALLEVPITTTTRQRPPATG